MATYTEFTNQVRKRRRQRLLLQVGGAALALAMLAAGIYFFFGRDRVLDEKAPAADSSSTVQSAQPTQEPQEPAATKETANEDESKAESQESSEATPEPTKKPSKNQTAAEALAALPALKDKGPDRDEWSTKEPVEQTLDTTVVSGDFRLTALPECGTVDRSYFDHVTFLGDSLTEGLELYDTTLTGTGFTVLGYRGIGPNSIVNNTSCTDRIRNVTEIPLEALVASQPDAVYILLGTNSLVATGNDDSFINYYGAMIDLFQQTLDPAVKYYIQAIPGVQASVKNSKPGLDNDRIRQINGRLAALAVEKGCYFLDLQQVLTNRDGSQIDEYSAKDGIHMQPVGYQAWVDYLFTHVAYDNLNPYVGQNPLFSTTDHSSDGEE